MHWYLFNRFNTRRIIITCRVHLLRYRIAHQFRDNLILVHPNCGIQRICHTLRSILIYGFILSLTKIMLAPFRFIYSSSVVTVQPLRHQVTKKRYEFQSDIKKARIHSKNIQMRLFLFISNIELSKHLSVFEPLWMNVYQFPFSFSFCFYPPASLALNPRFFNSVIKVSL